MQALFIWAKGSREFRLMEFIDYNKKEVDKVLEEELDWEYYGGSHHENHYTKFSQSYYLPQKFIINKCKTELSALVHSSQITREETRVYYVWFRSLGFKSSRFRPINGRERS